MTSLEHIFLKNVVLYLEDLEDVVNFILMNKKCTTSVQTMYINPYKLSTEESLEKIKKLFSVLQTFYLVFDEINNFTDMKLDSVSLIELDFTSFAYKDYQMFHSLCFTEKVKKLRMFNIPYIQKAHFFSEYKTLSEVMLWCSCQSKELYFIPDVATLRKFTLVFPIAQITKVVQLDFKKRANVKFVLVIYDTYSYQENLICNVLDGLPPNVEVYAQFMSLNLMTYPYVPPFHYSTLKEKELGESYFFVDTIDEKRVIVYSNVVNCDEVAEQLLTKSLLDQIEIHTSVLDLQRLPVLDFTHSTTIKTILISCKGVAKVYVPKTIEVITLSEFRGDVCMDECKPRCVNISQYNGQPVVINTDKLKRFIMDLSPANVVTFVHKGKVYDGVYIVDCEQMEEFQIYGIYQLRMLLNYLVVKGGVELYRFRAMSFCLVLGKLSIKNLYGDVDLSNFECYSIELESDVQDCTNNVKIGNTTEVSVIGGIYGTIEVGKINTITFTGTKVKNLLMTYVDNVVFDQLTTFDSMKVETIWRIQGNKRLIKQFKMNNKANMNL
ncbi:hypothetical protein EIN_249130 [Entamoeba invadens IP1]|uniref:Uncharacterized protein n=1 Tax=Entamoeba invadens IP1 TaxID=370355 RepID=A0A0A1UGG3_ENTIV|nr:hypothetical protein EIN_249130 [Entamoeba invadens IP1]ELP94879.1 hypothetical protein EIN_249130 [Entamoeba invadens IP1]|eukprot:XP_004261650.1 hypothetical protein EIN_249130 [Entamoeba invadens IP1]